MQSVIVSPDCNPDTRDNDIAILRLTEPIDLNKTCVCSLCLAKKKPQVGEICATSGYGYMNSTGANKNLQRAVEEIQLLSEYTKHKLPPG